MTKIPLSGPKQNEWESMLTELLDIDEGLTDWEIKFLESINGLNFLTHNQFLKLQQIWGNRIGR